MLFYFQKNKITYGYKYNYNTNVILLNSNALNLVLTFALEKYAARSYGSATDCAKDTYFSGHLFHIQMAGCCLKATQKQTAHSIEKLDFGFQYKRVDMPRNYCTQL